MISIVPADSVSEAKALQEMDAKIYLPSDLFDLEEWREYECFWIVMDGNRIGSMALGRNLEFSGEWDVDKPSPGCLYISSTSILPEFQGQGIGSIAKQWQIDFARRNGFSRISTNCRQGNTGSQKLNQKYGFKVLRIEPDYYDDPVEAVVVMELAIEQLPE